MERKKVTIKGIDKDAWEIVKELREIEQRFVGAILSDCIRQYWDDGYAEVG